MSGSIEAKSAWLARVLGYHRQGASGRADQSAQTADPGAARLDKGVLLWNSTRSYVGQQVSRLQQAILSDAQDEPDFDEIKANLGNLEEVLEVLDDSLSKKLGELRGATDPATKATLSAEARAIVARFQKYLAEDGLMNDIDQNGFVELDIKAKVSAALTAVMQTI
jgi:hypothetical protein